MAKKGKKFDAPEGAEQQTITSKDVATVNAEQLAGPQGEAQEGEAAQAAAKPRLPDLFLENQDGVQYKFLRYALPKRAGKSSEGDLKMKVDGVEVPAWTTDSKGWAVEGTELKYIYLKVGDVSGYIVLQGNESIEGMEFTSGEGSANRPNPKSTSKLTDEQKAARQALATATREANKAKKEAGEGEGETEGSEQGEEQTA